MSLDPSEEDIFYQLTKVFRAKAGDNLILMDLNTTSPENREANFTITEIGKKVIELKLEKTRIISDPLQYDLTLVFALPNKPAKLEMVLQHATELGVTGFVLLPTDNSNFSHQVRIDRLEKILIEAVEQSERARVPQIVLYKNLDEYLRQLSHPCLAAVERQTDQKNLLEIDVTSDCDVLIGPEGGFSNREFDLLAKSTVTPVSLGSQILRNETAAIVACGIIALKLQR